MKDNLNSNNITNITNTINKNDQIDNINQNILLEKPIQLIKFEDSNFIINEEALDFINSIKDEIIVVSIIGKARTGKSYLMNLLLNKAEKDDKNNISSMDNKQNNGFNVDSKVYSCTKGIWIWGNYRTNQDGSKKILFIDSEGSSSIDRSTKTTDSKIYALIVLISSLFLYNTNSNIDENSINELSLAAHLSNSITTSASKSNSNISDKQSNIDSLISELAPKFIWILRDFSLTKVNPETGVEVSGKEYLDICLRKKNTNLKNSLDNNLIRENILKYFKERDCITLIRPIDDEVKLQHINNVPFNELKEDFKTEFIHLKNKIYKESNTKVINGYNLTGPALKNLLVDFVDAINKGGIPNINSAWDSVMKKEIENCYEDALSYYKKEIKTIENITDSLLVLKGSMETKDNCLEIFEKLLERNSNAFMNESYMEEFLKSKNQLRMGIDKIESKIKENNIKNNNRLCSDIIRTESKVINEKLVSSSYKSNNINDLIYEMNDFLNNFLAKTKQKGLNNDNLNLNNLVDFTNNKQKEIILKFKQSLDIENTNKTIELNKKIEEFNSERLEIDLKYKVEQDKNNSLEVDFVNLQIENRAKENEIKKQKDLISQLEIMLRQSQNLTENMNPISESLLRREKNKENKKPKIFFNKNKYDSQNAKNNTEFSNHAEDKDCELCIIF